MGEEGVFRDQPGQWHVTKLYYMEKRLPVLFKNASFWGLLCISAAGGLLGGCNKPVPSNIRAGSDSVDVAVQKRKVLLIVLQGAKGMAMKQADIPNIKGLLSHGIYSWDAVCDTVTTDAASWAALFTGVTGDKNGVTGDSYKDNAFFDYPVFPKRIMAEKPGSEVVLFNAAASLNDSLVGSDAVSRSLRLSDDKAVSDSAIQCLDNENPDVLMLTFNGVNEAGRQYGFSETAPQYMESIARVDRYIGDILAALRGRDQYAEEDWLIVITSNHGGQSDGTYGGSGFEQRNRFIVYANESFNAKEIIIPNINVPYSGQFPFFYRSGGEDHALYTDNPAYHFGATEDFTVEFNIRLAASEARRDNPIITNKNWNSGANVGWIIFTNGGNIRVNFRGEDASRVDFSGGPVIDDGAWHHITVGFDRDGHIEIYADGQFYSEGPSIDGQGNIDAGLPLTIGTHAILDFNYYGVNTGSLDAHIAGVRIWKTLLDPAVIDQWAFSTITPQHPDFDALVGYWKMRDENPAAPRVKDYSLTEADLTVLHSLQWDTIDDVLNPSGVDATQVVPHAVDLAVNVMAWMGMKLPGAWQLDGKLWILQ